MRAWICSAVACGSGGPPQARRKSACTTACGWPVRWCQAPISPFSSLRRPASTSRRTGAAGPAPAALRAAGPPAAGCASGSATEAAQAGTLRPGPADCGPAPPAPVPADALPELLGLPLAQQQRDLLGIEQPGQAEEVLFR